MKAIVITGSGGPDVLGFRDVEDPIPGPGELLVRVEASALNRADLLQRRGLYPAPDGAPQDIPGLELAGQVVDLGAGVTRFHVGDRVMGIVGGGAGAELACLHESVAMPVVEGMSWEDAAAIPEAFLTAFDAAVVQGGLVEGEWLALNAVGSGVGTAVAQVARAIGAKTVGCSRTESKVHGALARGLDVGVVGGSALLPERAVTASHGEGVAVAVDLIGGGDLIDMLRCLRPTGSLVLVGLMGGTRAELNLARLLTHRLHLIGTVLRTRPHEEKAALVAKFMEQLWEHFTGEDPLLCPVVHEVLPWAEVARGHGLLEDNATFGKVVLAHG